MNINLHISLKLAIKWNNTHKYKMYFIHSNVYISSVLSYSFAIFFIAL